MTRRTTLGHQHIRESWLGGPRPDHQDPVFLANAMRNPGNQPSPGAVLKRFDTPDEVRTFEKGRFELVHVGEITIGRAIYQPGWRWSDHVGPEVGESLCNVEHIGLVLSGTAAAAFEDGRVIELTPGTLFHIPPEPHDSWVVGKEEYVSLHFLDPAAYAGQ